MIITIDTKTDTLEDIQKIYETVKQLMQPKVQQTINLVDCPDVGQDVEQELDEYMIDSTGIVHDERIHSSPAKINADGKWRRRKNIDDNIFEQVTNELLGIKSPVPPVVTMPAPPMPPAPPAPSVVSIPVPPMPPAPPDMSEFTKLMLYITPLMETSGQGGTLKVSDLEAFALSINCEEKGKGKIAKLQELPHLIPLFLNLVNDHVNKNSSVSC